MNWMSILGLCMIIVGTILSFFGTYRNDKESQEELTNKIQEKNETIDSINSNNMKLIEQNTNLLKSSEVVSLTNNELISQNKEMIFRIEKYQKDLLQRDNRIRELEEQSKKSERGLVSITQFDGSYLVRNGGSVSVTGGTIENKIYNELVKLEKEKKTIEIINLCDNAIKNHPKWFTPYIFKAIGYINLNDKKKALELLDFVSNNISGDPEYVLKIAYLYQQLDQNDKSNQLLKTISKEMIQNIMFNAKKNENLKNK